MNRRIAVTGASGTGKSRVVEHLYSRLQLPINPVGSRSIAKSLGFDRVYDVDKHNLRGVFQRKLFAEKSNWEAANDDFLTDRTVFDNLAYTMVHGGTETMRLEELSGYIEAVKRYTTIIYLPVYVFQKLGDDPSRSQSEVYHQMYDMVIRALFIEYKIPNVLTLHCPLEERIKIIDSLLDEKCI
jgi:predicted ATPase